MSDMPQKQRTLVKARKAARAGAWLLVFGAAAMIAWGFATMYLPTVTEGVVLGASSLLLFVISGYTKKKLDTIGV